MTAITVLVDDRAGPGLLAEHGLALWIVAAGKRILFDTGQGGALLANARKLGVDLFRTDAVVLSHGHYDHTGGLAALLSLARRAKVYLHPSALEAKYSVRQGSACPIGMPEESRAALRDLPEERLAFLKEPLELVPGIGLTGPIPRRNDYEDAGGPFYLDPDAARPDTMEDEMAMCVDTSEGLVVVTGCAHAGLVNTLGFIQKVTGREEIRAVLGGFHLGGAGVGRLEMTADAIASCSPGMVASCHCTGEKAESYLAKALGSSVKSCRSGDNLVFM